MKFLELSPDVTEECCCDFGTVEIELLIVNHKLKFPATYFTSQNVLVNCLQTQCMSNIIVGAVV